MLSALGLSGARLMPVGEAFVHGEMVSASVAEQEPVVRVQCRVLAAGPTRLGLSVPDAGWDLLNPAAGRLLRLSKPAGNRVFFLEGDIIQAERGATPNLIVRHTGKVLRAERRLFHRFGLRKAFAVTGAVLPDGVPLPDLRATLKDLSPEGMGFHLWRSLPAGTQFAARNLFGPRVPEFERLVFGFKVMWSRGGFPWGFRHGAVFAFASEKEQFKLVEVLNRLQTERLVYQYRQLTGRRAGEA